jgi:hypothetical protein
MEIMRVFFETEQLPLDQRVALRAEPALSSKKSEQCLPSLRWGRHASLTHNQKLALAGLPTRSVKRIAIRPRSPCDGDEVTCGYGSDYARPHAAAGVRLIAPCRENADHRVEPEPNHLLAAHVRQTSTETTAAGASTVQGDEWPGQPKPATRAEPSRS